MKRTIMYVGTYTTGGEREEGIYIFEVLRENGSLKPLSSVKGFENPSYLAIGKNLYSVMEVNFFAGKKEGGVGSFSIDRKSGDVAFIGGAPSGGRAPCHIWINKKETFLFSANYTEGTVSVFPIDSRGNIQEASARIVHEGSGPNVKRQQKAHAHYVMLTPDEKYLCAVDLGMDKVMVYKFDENKGTLELFENSEVSLRPGCGPRHMTFDVSGKYAYVINELASDVAVLSYDPDRGKFEVLDYVSTLMEEFDGENYCSAIHLSPCGKYLYGSNRGHDSIAVFELDEGGRVISLKATVATGGKFPRDFAIEPDGNFLYAANQNTSDIFVFSIDKATGMPRATGDVVNVPSPVCIKFLTIDE